MSDSNTHSSDKPHARIGRPPKVLTASLARKITTLMATSGDKTLTAAFKKTIKDDPSFPSYPTVRMWNREGKTFIDDDGNLQSFSALYARAREERSDLQFEMLEEVIDEARYADPKEVNALRTHIDGKKWVLAKQHPRKYGDTKHLELSGTIEHRSTAYQSYIQAALVEGAMDDTPALGSGDDDSSDDEDTTEGTEAS